MHAKRLLVLLGGTDAYGHDKLHLSKVCNCSMYAPTNYTMSVIFSWPDYQNEEVSTFQ